MFFILFFASLSIGNGESAERRRARLAHIYKSLSHFFFLFSCCSFTLLLLLLIPLARRRLSFAAIYSEHLAFYYYYLYLYTSTFLTRVNCENISSFSLVYRYSPFTFYFFFSLSLSIYISSCVQCVMLLFYIYIRALNVTQTLLLYIILFLLETFLTARFYNDVLVNSFLRSPLVIFLQKPFFFSFYNVMSIHRVVVLYYYVIGLIKIAADFTLETQYCWRSVQ